jgi:hypothetical protein
LKVVIHIDVYRALLLMNAMYLSCAFRGRSMRHS